MMTTIGKLLLLTVLLYQCQVLAQTNETKSKYSAKSLTEEQLKTWYHKDFNVDTIPGVSLDKAYKELLPGKKGQDIIVAVLDTKIDIHHEDLKDQIWINTNEIPNNGIDDDKNGYSDDVNGWDFLSNTKGEFLTFEHLESTRIVRKYNPVFKGKNENEIDKNQKKAYNLYTKAYQKWQKDIVRNKESIVNFSGWKKGVIRAKEILDSISPKKEFKVNELDSLINQYKKNSAVKSSLIRYRNALRYNLTVLDFENYIKNSKLEQGTMLNPDFDERAIMGDDQTNIRDDSYGSPIVYGDVPFQHGTVVAGTLGASRSNNIGIKGFSDHIKIMPVVMVATGDEHDKDIALAIRYAVDNGAKVINMSWGKTLSSNQDWVNDAIKYAADKDVLLVKGAGNNNSNNDEIKYYLNDYGDNEKEFADNFLVVGASTWNLQKLKASFSNYGKKHVDVFAPGVKMYTTAYGTDKYTYRRGTSLASPVVAGIAGLLRAYYPELSASQVKQILIDSGTSYDVDVEIKQEDGSKIKVPFSELSKSGKVVNAYNAFLMAGTITSQKKN